MDPVELETQLAALKKRLAAQAADLHRLFMYAFIDMLRGKTRSLRDVGRALRAQDQCRIALKVLLQLHALEQAAKKITKSNERTIGEEKSPS